MLPIGDVTIEATNASDQSATPPAWRWAVFAVGVDMANAISDVTTLAQLGSGR